MLFHEASPHSAAGWRSGPSLPDFVPLWFHFIGLFSKSLRLRGLLRPFLSSRSPVVTCPLRFCSMPLGAGFLAAVQSWLRSVFSSRLYIAWGLGCNVVKFLLTEELFLFCPVPLGPSVGHTVLWFGLVKVVKENRVSGWARLAEERLERGVRGVGMERD